MNKEGNIAMITCPNCNELLGDHVDSCFNCGYDFKLGKVLTQAEKDEKYRLQEEEKRLEKERKEQEEKEIERRRKERTEGREKQILKNANYEYTVSSITDRKDGSISIWSIEGLLDRYASDGWRLHSVFRNELGKNVSSAGIGGVSSGSNATIEETIFIFERKMKKEED